MPHWGFLNQNILKNPDCEWKTKTPFASIRRISKDECFLKIRHFGLLALSSYKINLPFDILPPQDVPKQKQEEFNHTYFQGIIVKLLNLKMETFVILIKIRIIYLGKKIRRLLQLLNLQIYI